MQHYLASLGDTMYEQVYPLNQHERSHLMTQLFLSHSSREQEQARIAARMHPWAQHLRHVARE
ncbi:MAG: hypothetical protein DYH03_18925, partial [Nitrospira sp. NTP1]|nr:hypothetical protein [Nitrospira sp. NTP1]